MIDPREQEPPAHDFMEVLPTGEMPLEHLELDHLSKVKLTISAHLGNCRMYVRDVLALKEGSIVQLDKVAGEMTDIYVNGLPMARGEVVVIADELHVRVGEVVGGEKKGEEEEYGGDDSIG